MCAPKPSSYLWPVALELGLGSALRTTQNTGQHCRDGFDEGFYEQLGPRSAIRVSIRVTVRLDVRVRGSSRDGDRVKVRIRVRVMSQPLPPLAWSGRVTVRVTVRITVRIRLLQGWIRYTYASYAHTPPMCALWPVMRSGLDSVHICQLCTHCSHVCPMVRHAFRARFGLRSGC